MQIFHKMIGITRLSNDEEAHYFKLIIHPQIHNELIEFFATWNFPKEELEKIDTPFSELEGEYIFLKSKNVKVHLFVEKSRINMIIDTSIDQETLTKRMTPVFIFPKRES